MKAQIKEALKYSDYWTWFTEWLLGFGGKAAWPVLIISTLYMGAELYPGVNLPGGLNFAVFLAQLFALDMGGMGLVSLARQAKEHGHEDAAKEANKFGKVLVAIVITSLVTVGVKQFLSGIPALTTPAKGTHDSIMSTWIDPVIMVVEFVLVIARVVCAVLYGKVMHTLKHVNEAPATPPSPAIPAVDIEDMIRQAVTALQTQFDQRLQEITTEQARMLTAIQQVQNGAAVPQVDMQAIIAGVVAQFEGRFNQGMKRIEGEIKQQVLVSQAGSGTAQSGTNGTTIAGPHLVSLPQRSVSSSRVKQSMDEQKTARPGQGETGENTDCKTAVYTLLDQDNTRQPADLARMTGFPRTTVWRHWNRYHEEHGTRGLAGIVAGESEPVAQIETA